MKILFINSVVDFGSTGKIVRQLSDALIEEGHETLIAYGRNYDANAANSYYIGDKLATYWHVGMTRLFGQHGLHSNKATTRLIRKIESYNPDVIHIHNIHGYYLNVKMLMNHLKNRPHTRIVWTHHDCWAFSGSSAYFSYSGCKVWDQGCVECVSTKEYPEVKLFANQKENFKWKREAFSNFNNLNIVVPSEWLKNLEMDTFFNEYPITRIYNGIDLEVFKPQEPTQNNKIKILGVANLWEARKGLQDFVELAKRLDDRYHITLVGVSESQITTLPQNITGVQRTNNQQELVQLYSDADIYLNLSVEETLGMTTIEALATGTPVITYDKTAVPEVVTAAVGKVVAANDIDALVNTLETFSFDAYSVDQCVARAQEFAKETMIKNYMKMLINEETANG